METVRLRVVNEVGLHARPAAEFVKQASRFRSRIQIRNATRDSNWEDGKSILRVLTLGVEKGHEIELTVEGSDEKPALQSLRQLLESDFAGKI